MEYEKLGGIFPKISFAFLKIYLFCLPGRAGKKEKSGQMRELSTLPSPQDRVRTRPGGWRSTQVFSAGSRTPTCECCQLLSQVHSRQKLGSGGTRTRTQSLHTECWCVKWKLVNCGLLASLLRQTPGMKDQGSVAWRHWILFISTVPTTLMPTQSNHTGAFHHSGHEKQRLSWVRFILLAFHSFTHPLNCLLSTCCL